MSFIPPPIPSIPPPTPPASLTEYQYYSQFSMDQIGVVIHVGGVPTDVDNNTMTVTMYPVDWPTIPSPATVYSAIFSRPAIRQMTGIYQITFLASDTSIPGHYRIDWSFNLNTVAEVISTFIEVGPTQPAYDNLPPEMKQIVEDVWIKFQDGFDSPYGGPNLQIWFQSKFGRGRLAQLLRQTIQHLNTVGQPIDTYTIDGINGPEFPVTGMNNWSGLLNTSLTIEVYKQLMRAYVEDPDIQGDVKARVTRRDYLQRWGQMLQIEREEYKDALDNFKITQMFAGSPRVLVSGGVYGNFGPTRLAGNAAARPRYWSRFYGSLAPVYLILLLFLSPVVKFIALLCPILLAIWYSGKYGKQLLQIRRLRNASQRRLTSSSISENRQIQGPFRVFEMERGFEFS